MQISIITPAYNAERFLDSTIESVRSQTIGDWEMIVVDDGSSDRTRSIVAGYADRDARIRAVTNAGNRGVAAARSNGFAQAAPESEYILFLDHDDLLYPDFLSTSVKALNTATGAVGVHCLTRQTDLEGKPVGASGGTVMCIDRRKVINRSIVSVDRTEPTTFETLICDCCIPTPSAALIRRSALEAAILPGGILFDETVGVGNDWDLWLRLSVQGHFEFIDSILLDWRQHDSNGSRDAAAMQSAELAVRRKFAAMAQLLESRRSDAAWRYGRARASYVRRRARGLLKSARTSAGNGDWRAALRLARDGAGEYAGYLLARGSASGADRGAL